MGGMGGGDGHDDTARLAQGGTYQLAPGTLLAGRYRVESVLGRGGMGHVYLVRDEHFLGTQSLRSLKEMIPRFHDVQASMINFTREAMVLESLRHDHIPRVYDSFREARRAYLVLEYIEGQDLEQVIERSPGPLDPDLVTTWILQLCEIVEYLHNRNPPIIFRDLKPSNVILTPSNEIFLIDFGIAKVFHTEDMQTNVGTMGYAAPEAFERKAETRSDIYSLGAMAHHLLTKSDPRVQKLFSFHERPPRGLNPAVTPALETVVLKCLEQEKENRYQTIREMRRALEAAAGQGAIIRTGHFRQRDRTGATHTRPWGTGPVTLDGLSGASRVRWQFETEEEVRATPTVANGVIYIGSYDHNLYALDAHTGALRWKFATEGGICGQPAVWRNLVIIGSEDFNVYGIEAATGKEVWRYRAWHHVRSSPRIYDDRLYIGSDDGHMHAIDPRTGRSLWRYRTYREVQSSAAFANGVIFFGSSDEYLYAVDAITGERKWNHRTQGPVISSPAVADGYVYFGSYDFAVYALETKSGWLAWREMTDKFVISSPLIYQDKLYIGSTDKHLHCLERRTGSPFWKYPAGGQVNSNPAVADGKVYFGCVDGALYCVDAVTGKLRWRHATGDMVTGSPIIADGLVYIGSTDGCLYALDATV
jgi:eukaryotic-like serine/threonine-protein kinase